ACESPARSPVLAPRRGGTLRTRDPRPFPRHPDHRRRRLMAKGRPIPEGYHNVTPYLIVDGAAKAIDFYKKVFGAAEKMRMPAPGGKVGHAELTLGDSMIMLADEHPEMDHRGPHAYKGAAVNL